MLRYIIKRIIFAIPVLIGATFLVFTIMDLAPGDPARIILGSNATEAALASLRDSMGLNDPFLVRYGRFILGLLHGDLGTSYRNGQAVFSLIMGRLGNFWFALILVIIFSLNLGWLPSSGMQHGFPDNLISLILPTLTLGCGYAALIARTTRSSVLEVVRQDYIDMARAKGLTENAVIWKHMLKNALIPIVTVVGLNFGTLLGGSVLTESIFSWPGVGRFVVDSISYKDTPAVLGSVVTLAILFTIVNLIVDLLYAFLDPRIKSEYQSSWKRAKKK